MIDDARIAERQGPKRGRCCQITFAWCFGFKDMFNWCRALWHMDDNQLREICGPDYALYLVFLRFTSVLLFVITLFNCVVMVPLYATGEPMASDDFHIVAGMSKMNAATVLNITARHDKMIFAYICAVVVIPLLPLFMIFKFRQKYYGWKRRMNPMKEFLDVEIASFAIEVRNLPIDEGVESLQRRIQSNMLKLYPPDPITGKSVFVRARVIGDYNYLYKKSVELKQLLDELAFVQKKNREEGAIRRQIKIRKGLRCWCCGVTADEESHLKQAVDRVKRIIRQELSRQRNQNTGYGFLIFADEKAVKDFKHFGKVHF